MFIAYNNKQNCSENIYIYKLVKHICVFQEAYGNKWWKIFHLYTVLCLRIPNKAYFFERLMLPPIIAGAFIFACDMQVLALNYTQLDGLIIPDKLSRFCIITQNNCRNVIISIFFPVMYLLFCCFSCSFFSFFLSDFLSFFDFYSP